MPSIPCPACGRLLKLGEDLLGALVECPMCGTTFDAPQEEPPPPRAAPLPYRPAPAPAAAPAPGPPRPAPAPREFGDANGAGGLGARQRARLSSAVFWLQAAVALQALGGFCCCVLPFRGNVDIRGFLLVCAIIFKYLPLLFAAITAGRLSARRGYRLAYVGALLILLGSVWSLLETFGLFLVVMEEGGRLGTKDSVGMGLLGILIGVAGVVAGFVSGIKALIALGDPAIRRAFR
jgi:hypothetical protein